MKRCIIYHILCLFFCCAIVAQTSSYSTYYYQRATLFEQLPITNQDIVFVGNSITDGGEWSELFSDARIKNRGISGDISMGVYDRLDAIVNGQPRQIFLMIGINDLARDISTDSIVANIERIICKIQCSSPRTLIYLQSVLPVNDCFGAFQNHTKHAGEIKNLNNKLFALTKKRDITFVDLYTHFVIPGTEKMNPEFTNDGLHLLEKGYLKWAELIKPYILEPRK